jgi:hypothetical protein
LENLEPLNLLEELHISDQGIESLAGLENQVNNTAQYLLFLI